MLARLFEAGGISTIIVTSMPFWSEKVGAPRSLGVEFPFGHTLGMPGNKAQQLRVIREALDVLASAEQPDTVVHSGEQWPTDQKEAWRLAHPDINPPIVNNLARFIPKYLRGMRRSS